LTLRDLLNRIRWNPEERERAYEITYIHRGASENKRTIPFSGIKEIHSSWFTYTDPEGGEVSIPFHRVLEVRDIESGRPIWKKSRGRP
jgi:hypothetical protein